MGFFNLTGAGYKAASVRTRGEAEIDIALQCPAERLAMDGQAGIYYSNSLATGCHVNFQTTARFTSRLHH